MNFEHFQAHLRDSKLIEPREGWFEVDGHTFFNASIKSRKRIRAFVTDTTPWRIACVISERGNVLCVAPETDFMGLTVLHPEYMGWPGSEFSLMYEFARDMEAEG